MKERISEDLAEMKKKLVLYVDKGRDVGSSEVRQEPIFAVPLNKSKIKPLKKADSCDFRVFAVDCSTRTLKRANNWGIYLLRSAYALVQGRDIQWDYEEGICTAIGDADARFMFLRAARLETESRMALGLLRSAEHDDYLLLDGASYFGGVRKFELFLYEECEKKGIKLLTISKQSPMLHDEKGRDFMAAALTISSYPIWVYHPVATANIHENLYGDISVAKFCSSSPRVFRCDIMQYLTECSADGLLSPLTYLSEDPRCMGYPVTLWLAHDFSAPSDAKLLHYCEQVEKIWEDTGLLDVLHREELSCSFADELHGIRYAFQREWWGDYV